jgi:hypothetical protein
MTPEELLIRHGATDMEHPGGTLLAHLRRVRDQLAAWGARDALQLAGLCHAVYGTDGFPPSLVDVTADRPVVREVVGEEAEAIIHFYASCDRRHLYPQAGATTVDFLDRWSGEHTTLPSTALADFWELSFANELDIVRQSEQMRSAIGPSLWDLWAPARPWVSEPARAAFEAELAPAGA